MTLSILSDMVADDRMRARLISRELSAASLTAAGNSWKWQLRDKNGRWLDMGARVRWLNRGTWKSGKVVGSPRTGFATVEDANGDRFNVSTSRMTVDDTPYPQPEKARLPKAAQVTAVSKAIKGRLAAQVVAAPITAYPHAKRTPDGRVILSEGQLSDFDPARGPHTMDPYIEDAFDADGHHVKVLSRERETLHDAIVNDVVKDVKPRSGKKTNIFIGGGTASGKGTVTKRMPNYPKTRELHETDTKPPGEAVLIDVDAVKMRLPEWDSLERKVAARITHEESSMIGKAALAAAQERSLDIVLDGTGDKDAKSMAGKVAKAKADGYYSPGLYITVPAGEAAVRALERGISSGRHVPLDTLAKIHRDVSTTAAGMRDEFDRFDLFDTDVPFNAPGIPIVVNGKIVDQARWEAFLEKANVTDLQAAVQALERAEAKTYRDITVEKTGEVWSAERVKAYTIRTIQEWIADLTAKASTA